MVAFKFFSTPRPKGFNYKPIYYSEQKEEMMEREARMKKELGLSTDNDLYVPTIKGQFQRARRKNYGSYRQSTLRVLLILAVLLLIAYYLFFL